MCPTAATCGSEKITRGERGPSRTAAPSCRGCVRRDPPLVLAHVRQLGPAVDVADRVQPVVRRRREARRPPRAALPGSSPIVSSPSSSVAARGRPRPGARRRSRLDPSSSSTVRLAARRARPRPPWLPGAHVDAGLAQRLRRPARRGERLLARDQPRAALERSTTRVPSDAQACASSTPTTPPPRTTRLSGAASRSSPRGSPRAPPREARRSAGRGAAAGRDDNGPAGHSTSSPTATRRSPSSAPCRGRARPALLEPGELGGVVQLGITSSRRASAAATSSCRSPPGAPGTRRPRPAARRAQQRLGRHAGVVRALAADEMLLDDRDVEARPPSRPAATSPAGPAPITIASNAALGHGASLADAVDATIVA